MSFKDYYKKKMSAENEEERKREHEKKVMQAKSRPHFKELIKNIDECWNWGEYTSHYWCKYGIESITLFRNDKMWLSITRSMYMRPLGNETIFFIQYDLETGKEIYHYNQKIYDIPFLWWQVVKTNDEARLLIKYIKDNTKESVEENENGKEV